MEGREEWIEEGRKEVEEEWNVQKNGDNIYKRLIS